MPLQSTQRPALIAQIEELPGLIEQAVAAASAAALRVPYREGGWNSLQVVHHLADSHMNAYIRCKLAATETNPTLKPYDEKLWAVTADAGTDDLADSLAILRGLHARWARFLRSLPDEAWQRTAFHPENGTMTLESLLQTYAAHGQKHLGHIRLGLSRA